jgi:steroid delta-isomerase-like uncharacterized protein
MNSGRNVPAMMIDETTTLVTRWIAAFNAHNVDQIVALYTDDAELFDTGMKRIRKGRGEIAGWFTQRFQKMSTIQYAPTRSFFNEGEAVVCWNAHGHTPAILGQRWLSRPFQVEGVSVFRLHAGSIQWQHGYYDHLAVVERVLPPLKWLPLRL